MKKILLFILVMFAMQIQPILAQRGYYPRSQPPPRYHSSSKAAQVINGVAGVVYLIDIVADLCGQNRSYIRGIDLGPLEPTKYLLYPGNKVIAVEFDNCIVYNRGTVVEVFDKSTKESYLATQGQNFQVILQKRVLSARIFHGNACNDLYYGQDVVSMDK